MYQSAYLKIILSLIILITLQGQTEAQETIFVSPVGSDQNIGTKAKPFLSIDKAVNLAKQSNTTSIIYLRSGDYPIENTIVFGNKNPEEFNTPILFSAYRNEKVAIHGGISIPVQSIKELSYEEKSIFYKNVRNKIRKIDLKELGISNFGTIKNVGFQRPYTTAPLELFINKKAFHLARYPNKGNIPMGQIIDSGSMPSQKDYSNRGGKFYYDSKRPSNWKPANDIWISGYFNKGWAEDAVQVAKFDTINKTVTTSQATHYGFGTGAKWKQWYAFNIQEEVDEPGEYYLDRNNGVLYFLVDEETTVETIEVSLLEEPLLAIENISDVTISNITFECSRGMGIYIEGGANNTIDNCTIRNIGGIGICFGKGVESSISMQHELEKSKLKSREMGSLHAYVYANTTANRQAGINHTISNCQIYNVGAGGIILDGGDRKTLQAGNNMVSNCSIHDFNRIEKSYRPGIWIQGVGNTITNCEIYNAPMMAIWLHGNEHVIEYCDFHDVVRDMHDQGAIYYGRNPSERGNIVRYNYFHNLGNEHLSVSVYHDDGACDMTVHGNVFYKAGSMPVLIGGGNDHTYTNNIFIDCAIGIHVDNRKQGWAKGSGEIGGAWQFDKRLNAVDFQNPPYSTKYPSLVKYWENDKVKLPTNNKIENNIFYIIDKLIDGDKKWMTWKNNKVLDSTPLFWNEENKRFNLKNGKIVFNELTGFEAIDFDKIGYKK